MTTPKILLSNRRDSVAVPRIARDQLFAGSKLPLVFHVRSRMIIPIILDMAAGRGCGAMDSVLPSGGKGCGFDSRQSLSHGLWLASRFDKPCPARGIRTVDRFFRR